MAGTVAVSLPLSGLERDVVILDVSGPSRIFVDVKARFLVRMSGLSADPAAASFEWKLVDEETQAEVDFGYNADPPVGHPDYWRRRHGYFFVHVTSTSLGRRGMEALFRRPRRLLLDIRVASHLRRDDFVPPVRRPVVLTTFRLMPFPGTPTVPIYTVRQFGLDVPSLPDARAYENPVPRIKRVRWSAVFGAGADARAIEGPTYDVEPAQPVAPYPNLGWGTPDWTDGTHGARADFNRLGTYTVRCDIEFHNAVELSGLTHTFESVQHEILPDMAIVHRSDLPALVGTRTVLTVESDPRLCTDLPPYPRDEANLGVDYIWRRISLEGRNVADIRNLPDSAWKVVRLHEGTHRDPAPQTVTLETWTAPGRYLFRCDVTLWQYPSPGPLRATIFHVVDVVNRESPSRLAYDLEASRTLRLELLADTFLARARQLDQRFPGSPLATVSDRVWSRLNRRVPTMFATDDDRALSWRRVEAEILPAVFIPDRAPQVYPMRLYWQAPARGQGPHTVVLFDAVADELRAGLGLATERVYRAFGRSLPQLFAESFVAVQNGSHGDYPAGQVLTLGTTWPITGEAREFSEGLDKVATAAWALGWALSLVPEPGVTKVVGTAIVITAGLYFALRAGGELALESQTDALDLGESDTWFDIMDVASGLVGLAEIGAQWRWGFQVLHKGDPGWLRWLPGEATQATPLSRSLALLNTATDGGAMLVMGADTMATLDAIRHDPELSADEQRHETYRTVLAAFLQGSLMLLSVAPALPYRKLWRRTFWRSTFPEVDTAHGKWLRSLGSHPAEAAAVTVVDDIGLTARQFWARARAAGVDEALTKQWMERLGEEAHIVRFFEANRERYIWQRIAGAGMPDIVFVDLTPGGGGPPIPGNVECKGTSLSESFQVSRLSASRTGFADALEASTQYLSFPVSDDRTQFTVGQEVVNVLDRRIAAARQAASAELPRLELLRRHYADGLRRRRGNAIDPGAFLAHYVFVGSAVRMTIEEIRVLRGLVPGAQLFFYRARAYHAIQPELFWKKYLPRGYYQILRITNAELARQAYIAWSGPDDDDVRLTAIQIAALEKVKRLMLEALESGFDSLDAVEAVLEAIGELDRPLEWQLLEPALTEIYGAQAESVTRR